MASRTAECGLDETRENHTCSTSLDSCHRTFYAVCRVFFVYPGPTTQRFTRAHGLLERRPTMMRRHRSGPIGQFAQHLQSRLSTWLPPYRREADSLCAWCSAEETCRCLNCATHQDKMGRESCPKTTDEVRLTRRELEVVLGRSTYALERSTSSAGRRSILPQRSHQGCERASRTSQCLEIIT